MSVEVLHWRMTRAALLDLGLLVLSVGLGSSASPLALHLDHERSELRRFVFVSPHLAVLGASRVALEAGQIVYVREPALTHPWRTCRLAPHESPTFTMRPDRLSGRDRSAVDEATGLGSVLGGLRLGGALLNLAFDRSGTNDLVLECDAGFGGVAPGSAEATFEVRER